MKVTVLAVGRMKAGPEKDLAQRYLERFGRSGPALGLDFGGVVELAEGRAGLAEARRHDEAARLLAQLAGGAALIALDERGQDLTSEQFAAALARFRDENRRSLALVIGGPDGHDPALRAAADLVVSFGAMTWPHQLCRIMLAEQLYRATTILAGHPYHRG